MKVNRIGLALLFLLCGSSVSAESLYKYRVQLTDKSKSVHSLEHPETFLSERALARRASQGVAVDSTDLPVCRAYIERLESQGGKYISSSKWNNTVLMQVPDEAIALRFLDNSFVRSIKKVWVSPDSIMPRNKDRKEQVKNQWKKQDDYYGMGAEQIKIHHGDSLHLAGFKGKGIQIAVIDAGFYNVDAMKIFKNTTILGTHDFVNPSSDIYGEHNHGMKVLSCMAVNTPHVMVGTAPEASYWLLRSEDNDTEQPVEEDNWAAAVEFADSVGVDIVNTSLGYYSFDDPIDNYTYRQLDGHTSLMAASASYAAKKGLLVVCSAGNSGMDEWKKITPPADAEDILTIGAIDNMGVNAAFSSIGNTADGRIKPDVMAMGVHSAVVGVDGGTAFANGTSFASPIFCGLVACLWQACPWLTVRQLIQVVHEASDRNAYPDNIYGYGVTDMWKAYHSKETICHRTSRIPGCSYQHIDLLLSFLTDKVSQQAGHKTTTYIFKSQCRSVEQLQRINIVFYFYCRYIKVQCVIHNLFQCFCRYIFSKKSICYFISYFWKRKCLNLVIERLWQGFNLTGHI